MEIVQLEEVFKSRGQPTITYIQRDQGKKDRQLIGGIKDAGSIVALTGPSKAGKTCLCRSVVSRLSLTCLTVQSNYDLKAVDLWKNALAAVDFDQIKQNSTSKSRELSGEAGIEGGLSWAWLAGVVGKIKLGVKEGSSEEEIRERFLAQPAPELLIPVLQKLPTMLVLEDFHYLSDQTKRTVFQQWKPFVDSAVSAVIIGTSHRVVDLASANPDLVGRLNQVPVGRWSFTDLKKIAYRGSRALNVHLPKEVIKLLAVESVGLPLVMQALCRRLLLQIGVKETRRETERIEVPQSMALNVMYEEVQSVYAGIFEPILKRIVRGSTGSMLERVLALFVLDPLVFSMDLEEIEARLMRLPRVDPVPVTRRALMDALNGLAATQRRLDVDLLDWHDGSGTLYITEPTFLFFLRWRVRHDRRPSVLDAIEQLLGRD